MNKTKRKDINIKLVLALSLSLILIVSFYAIKNSRDISSEEVIEMVGQLMVLPLDEKPTVATVSDPKKLLGQPFFDRAEEGFKVLIYARSGKAILYDPKQDKIVEVGPINFRDEKDKI